MVLVDSREEGSALPRGGYSDFPDPLLGFPPLEPPGEGQGPEASLPKGRSEEEGLP